MRTNIDIDDDLLKKAMEVTGSKTKKAAVEEGLRRIVKGAEAYRLLKELKGKVDWEGDIDEMRRDRTQNPL
ncbi:MAG: type II toxin-antitoxin system VapB family antitoxin [Pseudomonadota bacterium]